MKRYYDEAEALQNKPRRTFLSPIGGSPSAHIGSVGRRGSPLLTRANPTECRPRFSPSQIRLSTSNGGLMTPPPTSTPPTRNWPSPQSPTPQAFPEKSTRRPIVSSVVQNLFEKGDFEAGVLAAAYEAKTALTSSINHEESGSYGHLHLLPPPLDIDDDGFIINAAALWGEVETEAKSLPTGIYSDEGRNLTGAPWWFVRSELQLEPLYYGGRCYFSLRKYDGAALLLGVVYHSFRLMGKTVGLGTSPPQKVFPLVKQPSTEPHSQEAGANSAASLLEEVDEMLNDFSQTGTVSLTPHKKVHSKRPIETTSDETRGESPPSRVPVEEVFHFFKLAKRAHEYRRKAPIEGDRQLRAVSCAEPEARKPTDQQQSVLEAPMSSSSPSPTKIYGSGRSTRVNETIPAMVLNSWIVASVFSFLASFLRLAYTLLVSYALRGIWRFIKESKSSYDQYRLERAKVEGYPRRPNWGVLRRLMKTDLLDLKVWHILLITCCVLVASSSGGQQVLGVVSNRLELPPFMSIIGRQEPIAATGIFPTLLPLTTPIHYYLVEVPSSAIASSSEAVDQGLEWMSRTAFTICSNVPVLNDWASCHYPPSTLEVATEALKDIGQGTKSLAKSLYVSSGGEELFHHYWKNTAGGGGHTMMMTPLQVGEVFRAAMLNDRNLTTITEDKGVEPYCSAAEYYWALFVRLFLQSTPEQSYRARTYGVFW